MPLYLRGREVFHSKSSTSRRANFQAMCRPLNTSQKKKIVHFPKGTWHLQFHAACLSLWTLNCIHNIFFFLVRESLWKIQVYTHITAHYSLACVENCMINLECYSNLLFRFLSSFMGMNWLISNKDECLSQMKPTSRCICTALFLILKNKLWASHSTTLKGMQLTTILKFLVLLWKKQKNIGFQPPKQMVSLTSFQEGEQMAEKKTWQLSSVPIIFQKAATC